MPLPTLCLGVLVMAIWGVNFPIVDVGLRSFDPFLLAALRFALAAFPGVFFLKRPSVRWHYVGLYGLCFGVGQFGLLFAGLKLGFSAGLASLVMQLQVFWTMGFARVVMGERVLPRQFIGLAVSTAGMALVASVTDGSVNAAGGLLVVGGSLSWGLANIVVKKAQPEDAFAFTAWASLVPPVPLLLISIAANGWGSAAASFGQAGWPTYGALAFMVYPALIFGFSVWGRLLRTYPTSSVAPLTLLVPVFGMAGSVAILGEHLGAVKISAIGIVFLGLIINQSTGMPRRAEVDPKRCRSILVAYSSATSRLTGRPKRVDNQD